MSWKSQVPPKPTESSVSIQVLGIVAGLSFLGGLIFFWPLLIVGVIALVGLAIVSVIAPKS